MSGEVIHSSTPKSPEGDPFPKNVNDACCQGLGTTDYLATSKLY